MLFGLAPLGAGEARNVIYLAGAILLLVGSGFLRVALQTLWTAHRRRRRERTALEPWLRNRDWSREGTEPITEEQLLPQAVAAFGLCALVSPFHTIWSVGLSWWGFWVVVGILDLFILLILVVLARSIWFRILGGSARLRWHSVPVAPGGTFSARFEASRLPATDNPAEVTLRCMRDGSPGGSATEDVAPNASEIWSETKPFPARGLPQGGISVELSFAIPSNAKGTNLQVSRPIRWQLVVRVPSAGPDFEMIFPVPIYARA